MVVIFFLKIFLNSFGSGKNWKTQFLRSQNFHKLETLITWEPQVQSLSAWVSLESLLNFLSKGKVCYYLFQDIAVQRQAGIVYSPSGSYGVKRLKVK